jgi:hypothetical protein
MIVDADVKHSKFFRFNLLSNFESNSYHGVKAKQGKAKNMGFGTFVGLSGHSVSFSSASVPV